MYAKVVNLVNGEYFTDAYFPGFDYKDEVVRVQVNAQEYYVPMSSIVYIKVDVNKTIKHEKEREEGFKKFLKGLGKDEN